MLYPSYYPVVNRYDLILSGIIHLLSVCLTTFKNSVAMLFKLKNNPKNDDIIATAYKTPKSLDIYFRLERRIGKDASKICASEHIIGGCQLKSIMV